eukprot:TRINITY_DN3845_c0_g5_i1.p1 TRINITY_DN3845_c0_g5~~TRINITY_DN3845_c0_g5_i1.p1  ORF type:complete len:510 (-),score=133.34 TRINITY_DN3845_c0_g5_i1:2069-3598(-)
MGEISCHMDESTIRGPRMLTFDQATDRITQVYAHASANTSGALSASNQLFLWGNNSKDQIAPGADAVLPPTLIDTGEVAQVTQVCLADKHTMVLYANDVLLWWGRPNSVLFPRFEKIGGGGGATSEVYHRIVLPDERRVVAIGTRQDASCLIDDRGWLYDDENEIAPPEDSKFVSVVGGFQQTVAITDHSELFAWGDHGGLDEPPQPLIAEANRAESHRAISGTAAFKTTGIYQIACGYYHNAMMVGNLAMPVPSTYRADVAKIRSDQTDSIQMQCRDGGTVSLPRCVFNARQAKLITHLTRTAAPDAYACILDAATLEAVVASVFNLSTMSAAEDIAKDTAQFVADMESLLSSGDLTLLLEDGSELRAHSVYLRNRCQSVFTSVLGDGVVVSGSLPVLGITREDAVHILRYLYTDTCQVHGVQAAQQLMVAADRYLLPHLQQLCATELNKALTAESFGVIAQTAVESHNDWLIERVRNFALRNRSEVGDAMSLLDEEARNVLSLQEQL